MKEATLEGQDGDEMLRTLMHLSEVQRQAGEQISRFRLHPDDWDLLSKAPGATKAIDTLDATLLGADCDVDPAVPQGTVHFEVQA